MKFDEYRARVAAIRAERLQPTTLTPLEFALERNQFEQKKLQKLLDVAENANFMTARRHLERWHRLLDKMKKAEVRFKETLQNVSRKYV